MSTPSSPPAAVPHPGNGSGPGEGQPGFVALPVRTSAADSGTGAGGVVGVDDITQVHHISDTIAALQARIVELERDREQLRRGLRHAAETGALLRGVVEACMTGAVGCACGVSSIARRGLEAVR